MASLAIGMTDIIRADPDTTISVTGKAYYSQNYTHVRWPWIILPVFVGVMSAVFLATTGVWRSSAESLKVSESSWK